MSTELSSRLNVYEPSLPDYYARVEAAASTLVQAVLTAEHLGGLTMPVCVEVVVEVPKDSLLDDDEPPSTWAPPVSKYRVLVEFWPEDDLDE